MAGDRGVLIGRDLVGTVTPTGDGNVVEAHVAATKREAPPVDPAMVDAAKELAIGELLMGLPPSTCVQCTFSPK
jgi:hypothetical protein